MEALGSHQLRENFRMLGNVINDIKGKLWGYDVKGLNARVNNRLKEKDLSGAFNIVRAGISVFNYLNMPNVWKRYKQTNILVRQELERIQKAYKAASSKDAKLLECWDLFLYERMKGMTREPRQFVEDYLTKFKEEWVESKWPGDKDWLAQLQQVQSFVKEMKKQLNKIQISLDDLF
ncbi:hypothetical protein P170DRAFT_473210 [Aspergillus steynii IBT 23096]|uniref:Uncharacterized protein n=1 Tax=Aspergillus steynii IBT 23096 TaxID=1392250 RepID=A0A2I2GKE6_9EURO|nr:uncharacterized protein P170DRAFT_473210 [Aspergillus steynii IBT 23096]PLB53341.1 hypothetical protein P170DRAFT_473210 [Aspergillus steynii IBT 23096]